MNERLLEVTEKEATADGVESIDDEERLRVLHFPGAADDVDVIRFFESERLGLFERIDANNSRPTWKWLWNRISRLFNAILNRKNRRIIKKQPLHQITLKSQSKAKESPTPQTEGIDNHLSQL